MAASRRTSKSAQHSARPSHGSSRSVGAIGPVSADDLRVATSNQYLEQATREQLAIAPSRPSNNSLENFSYDPLPGIFADPWQPTSTFYSSQPSSPNTSHSSSRSRPLVLRTQSHDDDRINNHSGSRLRTMTLESVTRSPPTSQPNWSRSRGRINSINDLASASAATPSAGPAMTAISSSPSTSRPQDANFGPPLRPQEPDHRQLLSHVGTPTTRRDASPSTKQRQDASIPTPWQILHLMNLTRGKLEGHLLYRSSHSTTWRSTFCAIDSDSGSLLSEVVLDNGAREVRILVQDLRGCRFRATYDFEVRSPVIEACLSEGTPLLKLRPKSKTMFNAWFAALLCWQPIDPGQHVRRLSKKPSLAPLGWLVDKESSDARPKSREEPTIIKVGSMRAGTPSDSSHHDFEDRNLYSGIISEDPVRRPGFVMPSTTVRWANVSCTLRENGELTMFTKRDNEIMATIQLSQLSRCAIQRLHPSVVDAESCIAIYPQYARSINACSRLRPVFLAFDSIVLFEAWFVLLRAFTIPELFGPQRSKSTDSIHSPELLPGLNPEVSPALLRIERSLTTKLSSARLRPVVANGSSQANAQTQRPLYTYRDTRMTGIYFAEILIDGQKKARSARVATADARSDPVWAESFEFTDLPSTASQVTIRLKEVEEHLARTHSSGLREVAGAEFSMTLSESDNYDIAGLSEVLIGEATIDIADLENDRNHEKWWPLNSEIGERVGDVLFMARFEQDNILMQREYESFSRLLHSFSNALTIRMAEKISDEPARLAQILLDIFQASGKAQDWIMYLAEEEIDGTLHEKPEPRPRFQRRVDSSEKSDRAAIAKSEDRLITVRETIQTASSEVSVLFRGNSLLTRSLDAHMKRLGKTYLEETIGTQLRSIGERDLECEVDPSKPNFAQNNWVRLLETIQRLVDSIFASAQKCPPELRVIFRHIRSFAVDKYGNFNRTVAFTSVSSFLFLRFFISAVLHPQPFGIIHHQPSARTFRTHTLVAKGLAALANLTTLGPKEPWMEPMNAFIKANREAFKTFIDQVCAIDSDTHVLNISPSYSTPLQIYSRLPQASREGFLSLPHLLDEGRSLAKLVNFWLDHYTPRAPVNSPDGVIEPLDFDLQRFHDMCLSLRQKTANCYDQADRRERRSSGLGQKWLEIAQRMEELPNEFWVKRSKPTMESGNLPEPRESSPMGLKAPTSSPGSANHSPRIRPVRRDHVPAGTPLAKASGAPDDEYINYSGGSAGEDPISRSASPMHRVSSRDSTDGEAGEGYRSSSRSKSKDRDRSGWALFSRKKRDKQLDREKEKRKISNDVL